MIDKKKIKEAAVAFDNKAEWTEDADAKAIMQYSFKKGAAWALQEFKKSLWHDAIEEPQEDVHLLVEEDFGAGSNLGMYYNVYEYDKSYESWEVRVTERRVHRWLYIDDLIKGGEE